MPTKAPFDPYTMWKSIYDQTEANWSETLQEMMGKESFSEGMGETLNHYLQYQELVNKMTETYLKGVNMPTRNEIADVASLVINLEDKVDNFTDDIEDQLAEVSKSREIRLLRRAVTNLDKKLDSVLEEIELMKTSEEAADVEKEVEETKAKKETKAKDKK